MRFECICVRSLLDSFTVLTEISRELSHLAVVDHIEAITERRDEVLVMGNDDKTTFEVVQGDDQGVDSVEIQMVGWLVEQEDVRLLPCDDGETDSTLLTSREQVHGAERHVARNTERTEMLTEPLSRFKRVLGHELFDGRLSEIEGVHVMLGENSDSQSVVDKPVSVLDLEISNERLNKGGFTTTVRSNQRDSRVEVNVDVDLGEDGDAFLVADVGLVETTEGWRDFLGVREHEDHRRILHNFGGDVDPTNSLDPGLHKGRSLGIATELVNELLDVVDLVHLSFALLGG